MTETVGRELVARLHRVAVELVLPDGLRVEDAVVLAEDLVAAGFTGSATVDPRNADQSWWPAPGQLRVAVDLSSARVLAPHR